MSTDVLTATSLGLYAKLLIAQGMVEQAEKNSVNQHQNYKYASADALVAIGKYALQAAGLSLVRTHWAIRPDSELLRSSNSNGREVVVRPGVVSAKYLLLDGDSGEKLELENEAPYVPGAGRGEDKAVFASLTELYGYMMLGILCIERVDAPNVSGRNDDDRTVDTMNGGRPPQRQQQAPPPRRDDDRPPPRDRDDLGTCEHCGAPNKLSQKSGKPYCGDMCWKKNENGRDY